MKKRNKSNSLGITLIALVVTIIVLMILSGVAVATLLGNNGIITRAIEAKDNQRGAAVFDEVSLFIAENTMIDKLNSVKGVKEPKKTKEDVVKELARKGYLINDEPDILLGRNGKTERNVIVIGSITIDFNGLNENSNTLTPTVTGVDFGTGKTARTIELGEDLTIGTESFRVLSKNENQIIAVPHYNITLVTPEENDGAYPNQTTGSPVTSFSTEPYWEQGTDTIDMLDSRNNIQKYITAYSTKLSNATEGKVIARIARYSEMNASGVTKEIRNPGLYITEEYYERYWLGSSDPDDGDGVWRVNDSADIRPERYGRNNGVRPLIVITLN